MENFDVIEITTENGCRYFQWKEIPIKAIPGIGLIGKRIWVAGELSTEIKYLYSVHFKGERYWPNEGGYVIKTHNGYTQHVGEYSCRLHPSEYSSIDKVDEYDDIIRSKYASNDTEIV